MLEKTTPKMDAKDYQLIADRVLKILKKNQKEQEINWDFSAAASKGDIIGLKDTITENKNDTDLKIAEIKSDLEKTIAKNKNDLEKAIAKLKTDLQKTISDNKNDLQKTISDNKNDLEKTIAKLKNDTDLKLKDIEKKIVESKNVLLQWILGMMTGYTILLIVILRFFEK